MKILHLYKDYFPVLGGIENHIKLLAEGQAARGHDVTVLVTSAGRRTERLEINGVHVVKAARLATVASTPLSLALPWLLRGLEPDVANLHFPYPLTEVANWLVGHGRRTVVTYHSDIVRQQGLLRVYAPLMRHILATADRIIATSPPYVRSSTVLAPLAARCSVVPLGVETERFADPPDPAAVAALRARLLPVGAPQNAALLLFVGRHRYYKGVDDLIKALPSLPAATLVAAGEGPMTATWQDLARRLGVAHQVRFPGDVPDLDLPLYFHAADLFVLPGNQRSEAFGLVLAEAMAAGLPVVSTELGTGTSWVNQHGMTGFVVPPLNPPALAAAIELLLANHDLRRQMGRAARARAVAEFDKDVMVDRTLAVYDESCR